MGAGRQAGFGTSATRASRVWFTLRGPNMTEVYYPDLAHPSARELTFMVDGKPVTCGTVTNDTLIYTQTSERAKHWRLIRTYVTDPERATVLVKVRFDSLDGDDHDLELAYRPAALQRRQRRRRVDARPRAALHDPHIASALVARPALTRTSSGYKGHDDACSSTPTTRCGPGTSSSRPTRGSPAAAGKRE